MKSTPEFLDGLAATPMPNTRSRRANPILFVDDEPAIRAAVAHLLEHGGFAVATAADGHEALDKFKGGTFSLVITDMKMPAMSGMELMVAVKNIAPRTPVVILTGHGTIDNAVEAMQAGAADYVLKPPSFETLQAVARRFARPTGEQERHRAPLATAAAVPSAKLMLGDDTQFLTILHRAQRVAPSMASVLIEGETGTGKELLAAYIHRRSRFDQGPFIAVNCAALPDALAESEFFGHEKGAFTGALHRKIGKFELAHHGTLLLDEVSELALPLQTKLLRVLQEKKIDRVGGDLPLPIDTRVIATSNIHLQDAVEAGRFRADLFYRLNVITLRIPPLRERRDDILTLAEYFLRCYSALNDRKPPVITPAVARLLLQNEWRGNIRELENAMERAALLCGEDALRPDHLFEAWDAPQAKARTSIRTGGALKDIEQQVIVQTLEDAHDNRTRAAEILGISIRTLRNKLREYKAQQLSAAGERMTAAYPCDRPAKPGHTR